MDVNEIALSHNSLSPIAKDKITRNRFEFINVIGRGGFGKVWKVIDKKDKKPYAIKEMRKVRIIDKKSEPSIRHERTLLSQLNHPFIVNMHYAFQDYENLYIALDYLKGGDLRYHLLRHRKFPEEKASKRSSLFTLSIGFFIACMLIALEYIHSKQIVHRDIKPENMVFDEYGYLRLTDFGISKELSSQKSNELSGTPGYMSPEVTTGQKYSYGADHFAIGVIAYEMMFGKRPYIGKTKKEIKEQMLSKTIEISLADLPKDWSGESADFINKLLERKPENRLGYLNHSDIFNHPWLRYYPWEDTKAKRLRSPFAIIHSDNFDKRYCEQIDKIDVNTQYKYNVYYKRKDYAGLFKGYTFYREIDTNQQHQSIEKPLPDLSRNNKLPHLIIPYVSNDYASMPPLIKSMSNFDIFVKRRYQRNSDSICNNNSSQALPQQKEIEPSRADIDLLSILNPHRKYAKDILLGRDNSLNDILMHKNKEKALKAKAFTSSASLLQGSFKPKGNTIKFTSRNAQVNPYLSNKSLLPFDNSMQQSLRKELRSNSKVSLHAQAYAKEQEKLVKGLNTSKTGERDLQLRNCTSIKKAMSYLSSSLIERSVRHLPQNKSIDKLGQSPSEMINVQKNRESSTDKLDDVKTERVIMAKPTSIGLFHKIKLIN